MTNPFKWDQKDIKKFMLLEFISHDNDQCSLLKAQAVYHDQEQMSL